MRHIAFMAVGLLMSGCVGIGVVHKKVNQLSPCMLHKAKGQVYGSIGPNKTTKLDVQSLWGEPDNKDITQTGNEAWRYKRDWSYAGIIPMIGIGIPLIVPTGNSYTTIYFEGEQVVRCNYEHSGWSGFACGYRDTAGNVGCGALEN